MRSRRVSGHIGMAMLVLGAFASGAPAAEPTSGNVAAPAPAAAAAEAPKAAPQVALVRVQLHTDLGDILLGLDPQHAPITAANFLSYVDQKRFDGSTFYRAVKLDDEGHSGLVQGGLRGDPERVLPPIAHEAPGTTGLKHLDGAISMARAEPGTAAADFFIVIGDLPSLDGQPGSDDPGYAVFGRVLDGMDVVRKILERPRDPQAGDGDLKGQMIADPVQILTVRRVN
jgi:peptidyl-prolyl cis-trans isomerase A (cyclophilin A)